MQADAAAMSCAGCRALRLRLDKLQDVRAGDAASARAVQSSRRGDLMVAGAAVGLVVCLLACVALAITRVLNDQTGGLVMGLLASIAGYFGLSLRDAYSYEFGSSRSSQDKQTQLGDLTAGLMDRLQATAPPNAPPSPPPAPAPGQTG
jgi:hypothetical protein